MVDKRITDPTINSSTFTDAKTAGAKLLIDANGWAEAKNILIALLGNSYLQGSTDGITYTDTIDSNSNYIKFSTDGGSTFKILDFTKIPSSIHNAVTIGTSSGLSLGAGTQVLSLALATITAAGAMSAGDKIKVDKIIITGDGLTFLANDGTYKTLADVLPGDTKLLFDDNGTVSGEASLTFNKTDVILTLLGKFIGNQLHLVNELKIGTFTGTAEFGMLKIEQIGTTGVYLLKFYTGAEWQTIATLSTTITAKTITLPAYQAVTQRIANAVEGTDYETGWVLAADGSGYDLIITHGLGANLLSVKIFEINGDGTQRELPNFSYGCTGILQNTTNQITIEGLVQDILPLRIELQFK